MSTYTGAGAARVSAETGVSVGHPAWYALHVRSRFETLTANTLKLEGYGSFVPCYQSKRVWSDRLKRISLPLFPGYVFARFDAALDSLRVLNYPGVVRIVSAARRPIAVDDREMASMVAIANSGVPAQPWPFLAVGRPVLIERGPLAGVEGIVIRFRDDLRLIASISILGRSVGVQMEREWVRPLR